jgi:transcriptional regulator with XRE-family HTH domain
LKEFRIAQNLSQIDIANAIGVSQQYYSLIESGKRLDSLTVEIVSKLANILNVSIEEIFYYEDQWSRKED